MAQKLPKDSIMQERRRTKIPAESLGIYIHVPFCKQKCAYCDFYSKPCQDKDLMQNYVAAVCLHLKEYFEKSVPPAVDTVYFGGGTPSLLATKDVKTIMKCIKKYTDLSKKAEITMECNPESADFKFLHGIRKIGINRVSFGIQSAHDDELFMLGRLHNFKGACEAVEKAKKAKIENISVDLMYGLPGQTMEKWQESVEKIIALEPQHISAYALKLEEGTPLFKAIISDKNEEYGAIPDDDLQADMYFYLVDRLEKSGFTQYEISNFAREGFRSRHNSRYWDLSPYLGLGPAAHSFYGGRRFAFVADTAQYIAAVNGNAKAKMELLESDEELVAAPRHGEYIMLRLRTADGIDENEFYKKFKLDFAPYASKMRKYTENGYCKNENSRWFLTPKGFFVSNTIIADVLGETNI